MWVLEYPSSQLDMGCGGVGQSESGGVKQWTAHFYSFISFNYSLLPTVVFQAKPDLPRRCTILFNLFACH